MPYKFNKDSNNISEINQCINIKRTSKSKYEAVNKISQITVQNSDTKFGKKYASKLYDSL